MKTLPVAIQLYSVRNDLSENFEAALRKVKEIGYDGVEFAGLYNTDPAKIRDLCKELDLVPISAHVSIFDMMGDTEALMSAYETIGVKYMAIPSMPEDRRVGAERWEETVKEIHRISEIAKKHGITLLYHNHDFEFKKIDGENALDILYKTIPADVLQTEIDTCWANVGGENPADFVRKYTGRAPVVHLKDFVMAGKKPTNMYELIGVKTVGDTAAEEDFAFRPIGYGVQDMPSILEASIDAGAEWVVVEQDRPSLDKTPMECAQMSREFLKKLGW